MSRVSRNLERQDRGTPTRMLAILVLAGAACCGCAAGQALGAPTPAGAAVIRHELAVRVEPTEHVLEVRDRAHTTARRFVLHAELAVTIESDEFKLTRRAEPLDLARYGFGAHATPPVPLIEYELEPIVGAESPESFVLSYRGKIHHALAANGAEYARSFTESPGFIDAEGVYLAGSTAWVPQFGRELVSFVLDVDLPAGFSAVSQGRRTDVRVESERSRMRWNCPHPMDEIYLVAARFTEYTRAAGNAEAQVFLRTPEPALAARYLEATAGYLDLYSRLIGPYPYEKFALVENCWESGYGMPSFTLLGSQVIRLPFILHSSYPHEILHNWWGNSVFVDYDRGNWCEGLTAYLADHLVKEGQGRGAEYRRDALKSYRDYVRAGADFPLTEFRSRHSGATQAVGYGKCLMLWHMLRTELGDDEFRRMLANLYRTHRFTRISFPELEKIATAVAGRDLAPFFTQWVTRTGAPEFALKVTRNAAGGADIHVEQTQAGEPYAVRVKLALSYRGNDRVELRDLLLTGKSAMLTTDLEFEALNAVELDPDFDVFRRLDRGEIPASFGQLFGAERSVLILPSDDAAGAWQQFAAAWQSREGVEVVRESDISAVPVDRSVWVLGSENRWRAAIESTLAENGADLRAADALRFGVESVPRADHSFAVACSHPADPELALGWVGAARADALPGLARKLPHYGKYSYLAFSGGEPTNVIKGEWVARGTPLKWFAPSNAEGRVAARTPAPALAQLAPVFDPARLVEHVRRLAADEMEGRGVGTPGIELATKYIAGEFHRIGLEPGGKEGSYLRTWTEAGGPDGKSVDLKNVIGVLRGTDAALRHECVVLGAHYDHLGRGWPDVHTGDAGQIHNGADDNASGIAVMLEVAALLKNSGGGPRSIVFVAFSGEEWQLRGSRHFLTTLPVPFDVPHVHSMINLDCVGRLADRKLLVFGAASADEWPHIARGIGFTTGIESLCATDPGSSDHLSFHRAGVPAIQLFSGAHEDYHRPTDDVEKIDASGLVKVATWVREGLQYLSERPKPLTNRLANASPSPDATTAPTAPRATSLGTVPDFTFAGPGVRIEKVSAGSAAERAGLLAGDVLLAMDSVAIENLQAYSTALRARKPGDRVVLRVRRAEQELVIEAVLGAR
ncbi:MAG: M20/M25/M40 family metallo-hydrolase [Planctomycetota bacterium]